MSGGLVPAEPHINYVDKQLKALIEELKSNGCLSKDFTYRTQEEQVERVEQLMDTVIRLGTDH